MANPYKGDGAGARSFLGALGFDTSRLKDSTAISYAGRAEKLIGEGREGFTRQDLRRHSVTPEHPNRQAPQRPQFQAGPTREQRATLDKTMRPFGKPGKNGAQAHLMRGNTKADLRRAASAAARGNGKVLMRVQINKNEWRMLSLTPKQARALVKQRGRWVDVLGDLAAARYGDRWQPSASGGEVEFYVA